jgi:hypothetical protein
MVHLIILFTMLINPEITLLSDELVDGWELSLTSMFNYQRDFRKRSDHLISKSENTAVVASIN